MSKMSLFLRNNGINESKLCANKFDWRSIKGLDLQNNEISDVKKNTFSTFLNNSFLTKTCLIE